MYSPHKTLNTFFFSLLTFLHCLYLFCILYILYLFVLFSVYSVAIAVAILWGHTLLSESSEPGTNSVLSTTLLNEWVNNWINEVLYNLTSAYFTSPTCRPGIATYQKPLTHILLSIVSGPWNSLFCLLGSLFSILVPHYPLLF